MPTPETPTHHIITGYSQKLDGLLIVVEATNIEEAKQQLLQLYPQHQLYHHRWRNQNCEHGSHYECLLLIPNSDWSDRYLDSLIHEDEYLTLLYDMSGPTRCHKILIAPLQYNTSIDDAVQW